MDDRLRGRCVRPPGRSQGPEVRPGLQQLGVRTRRRASAPAAFRLLDAGSGRASLGADPEPLLSDRAALAGTWAFSSLRRVCRRRRCTAGRSRARTTATALVARQGPEGDGHRPALARRDAQLLPRVRTAAGTRTRHDEVADRRRAERPRRRSIPRACGSPRRRRRGRSRGGGRRRPPRPAPRDRARACARWPRLSASSSPGGTSSPQGGCTTSGSPTSSDATMQSSIAIASFTTTGIESRSPFAATTQGMQSRSASPSSRARTSAGARATRSGSPGRRGRAARSRPRARSRSGPSPAIVRPARRAGGPSPAPGGRSPSSPRAFPPPRRGASRAAESSARSRRGRRPSPV